MAINDIVQTIAEARVDARSLSEFVFKPAGFKVARRLAPPVDTLQFYINRFDATKATTDAYIATIPNIVNEAINNTAVEHGVLADTFVTATKKTPTAVARSMRDVNSDMVSVLDFYDPIVTPNNHTTAFNNAITYINSLGGGTLQVPDGVYTIDPAIGITLKDNVELRGSKNTVITCGEHNLTGYALLRVHNTSNVSISNIKVDGNRDGNSSLSGEWGMGISVRSAKHTTIRDVSLTNCWGDGLYVGRTNEPGADSFSDGLVLENIYADNNRRQGISIISLKNASFKNLYIKNTNGTAPEAGLDFEPNYADEWLHNIKVENIYTENNSGAGVQVYFGPLGWRDYSTSMTYRGGSIVKFEDIFYKSLRSTLNKQPDVSTDDWIVVNYVEGDRIKIDITNHVDVASKSGYYSLGHQDKANLSGVVKVHNASYYTEDFHNVFVQNNMGDAVQVYFYDCEFINNITSDASNYHVRIANAPANYKMGGVHLIRPTFRCEGIDTVPVYIYANNSNGLANINLSVTDIVSAPPVASKVQMITRAVENFVLGDRFNNNTQSNLTSDSINSTNFIDTYTIDGERNVTINSVSSGKRVRIVNNKTTRHVISLKNGITILGVTNASTAKFSIEPHGYVDLIGVSTTALKLVSSSGLVNLSKTAIGTISLPASTAFLANETKLVATVTSLSGNQYSNTVVANTSIQLGTNYTIRAEFSTQDVIQVYITNLTSAPITLGATSHYINLSVL